MVKKTPLDENKIATSEKIPQLCKRAQLLSWTEQFLQSKQTKPNTFVQNKHTAYIHTRRLVGSTDQAYSSGF